jgi:putative membrane protein
MTMHTAPLRGAAWLATWTPSPVADALIALALVCYLALLIRLRRNRRSWPALRTLSALAAATILVLVVNGALAVYGHHLFWVHMIVHLLLITVVPALMVWAQPIRLLHDAGGPAIRARIDRLRRMFRPRHCMPSTSPHRHRAF